MKKKWQNIKTISAPLVLLLVILALWQGAYNLHLLPPFIIPSPSQIVLALWQNKAIIAHHSWVTIVQATTGLVLGVILAFILSIVMDSVTWVHQALYPYLIVSQTIPTIAIAPILVLLLGYDMAPKIVLVTITTVFPMMISILQGFSQCDKDAIQLLTLMGANQSQLLYHLKIPQSLPYFFSGLRISVSYAFVSSVAAEWLGGFEGLGAYLIQTRKAFNYDQMFAVIIVVSCVSLLAILLVKGLEHVIVPWAYKDQKKEG